MSDAPRSRPYHHGDLRRALLDAALEMVAEHGPAALSLREVARRAGVSHAAPTHHFRNKAGLLTAIAADGYRLFESEFGRIMLLTLLIAAPALVLLYLIEGVLGLINRFAQQLNVFSLSQSLKAVAAVWIIWIQLATLVPLLQEDILSRGVVSLRVVRALLGG